MAKNRSGLLAVLLLICAAALQADTHVIDLGQRKVRVREEGAGPSVIFEAGFWSTLDSWDGVIPDIAKIARVFAYDRAGLGGSDLVAGERSYVQLMTELHELLQHEKVPPPYVFVGHSYGGLLARVFYRLYPAEVKGIVFVDPMNEVLLRTHPDRAKFMQQQDEAVRKAAKPGVSAEWAFLKSEYETGYAQMKNFGAPDVPMALLVGSIDEAPTWRTTEIALYGEWVTKRDDSLLIVTPNSAHAIMRDEPDLVTRAIKTVLYPSPIAVVTSAAKQHDAAAAIAAFREIRAHDPANAITPVALNRAGYSLLREGRVDEAVKIFAENVAEFPSDANAYDSLGEAYAAHGDRELALANYRKSLELNPKNDNARAMIERLTAKP
ncbi:MAG TPA: alpha/beta fold hydrolase [Thermoanaerobaculia bacterium]|nr:alpha/beta fold hydrolase [Thermoanaerobaculia bacterium]